MIFYLYLLFRISFLPVILVAVIFNKKIRERFLFELKVNNKTSQKNDKYDYAFELSSEGELELIKPVLEYVLENKKKVQLIFSSESVYSAITKLEKEYSENLTILCLPILSFLPFGKSYVGNWIKAENLYLTRYDFFPELIKFGQKKYVDFVLLSGSIKKYQNSKKSFFKVKYHNWVYKSFTKILLSLESETETFCHEFKINKNIVRAYDFRPLQILNRIENSESLLQNRGLWTYCETIRDFKSNSIIFGSFWIDEIENLSLKELQNSKLCFVPHQLDADKLYEMKKKLEHELDDEVTIINEKNISMLSEQRIVILALKGVLCELYQFFDLAYIAGGFRSSVHSLLEPFLSGTSIVCGPNIHKSTEYDLIAQEHSDRIRILAIRDSLFFDGSINSNLENLKNKYNDDYTNYIKWLDLIC